MSKLFAVAALLPMLCDPMSTAAAETVCPISDAGAANPAGHFLSQEAAGWKPQRLPLKGGVVAALDKLDAHDEGPLVHEIDLNRDRRRELLLAPPAGRLCGNGGCPYVLLAAGSLATIGEFFGNLALLEERINGYRIIQAHSHIGAGLTSLDTYVFDRGRYRLAAHVVLESCGFEQWQRQIRK